MRKSMSRILLTGASGGVGTRLRQLLPPIYPDLLLSDLKAPADLAKSEKFKAADLADLAQVEAICEGVEGIIHLGGVSVGGPWDTNLKTNIIGCNNLSGARGRMALRRWVSPPSTPAGGSYPGLSKTAPIGRCGPTAVTASARRSARRSVRSMPTSTA